MYIYVYINWLIWAQWFFQVAKDNPLGDQCKGVVDISKCTVGKIVWTPVWMFSTHVAYTMTRDCMIRGAVTSI